MRLAGRILLTAILTFLFIFAFMGQGYAKPTCGILWFYPDEASTEFHESRYITNRYAILLDQLNIYEVIPPEQIEQSLGAERTADPCRDKDCAINIGKMVNADYIIFGTLGHVGGLYSLETTFLNVETATIVNSAVTDLEGTREEFIQKAPPHNIRSLLNVQKTPPDWGAPTKPPAKREKPEKPSPDKPAPKHEAKAEPAEEKAFQIGPRIGGAGSDDGFELGIGFEVRFSNLSFSILANEAGFASGLSYYLHASGNSPFLTLSGAYYDDEDGGVDEIGRIYGLLAGYRYYIMDHLDIRAGIGAAYINWDQTERPFRNDEEYVPIGEITFGYMF
ncbi:MAG: hypothetical protein U5L07_01695 [Desulfobacterales bacterium]|nr:hypothetical protein [Desulfobacterales bacterium]